MAKQSSKEEQNINVFVRIRPNNPVENEAKTLEVLSKKEILSKTTYNQKRYVFDRVFDCHSSQQEIYNAVVSPLIPEVISGYNCTVFAYGQTGTGKTYTMEGFHDQDNQISSGIIPRALAQIFKVLSNMNTESSVKVSYLELYNEELFDLLSQCNTPKAIRIFEDKAQKGSVILQGLEELSVTELGQVYKILEQGSERRRIASTLMNSSSSRSHAVFTIVVHTREITVEGEELVKTGKLNLVDLAGSENISKSGAIDKRAREAGSINQSLLTLGRVIKALTEKNTHVPYRESKLTRILQDSLGGRTKTSLIATISSANVHMEETLNTLEYAMRARCIQNRPELNQKISRTALINQYSDTIEKLQRDLVAMRTGTGIFVDEDNYTKLITDHKAQKIEITEKMNYIKKLESDISDNTEKLQTLQASWVEAANNIEYLANEKKILEKDLVLVKEANEQHVRELKVVKDKHKHLKDETDKLLCDIQKHSVNEDTLHRKVSYLYQTSHSNKSIANSFYNMYNKLYTELISSVERCISFAMKAVLDTDALFKNQSKETTYGKIVLQINDLLQQSNEIREFKSKHIENKDMLGTRFNTYFNSLQTLSQCMQERSIEFSTKFDDNLIYLRNIISSFSDEKGASLMTIMPNLFNIRQSAANEFMAMTDILKDFHCTIIANMDELINEVENLIDENKESHQVIETLQEKLDKCYDMLLKDISNMKQTCTTDFSSYKSRHQRTITKCSKLIDKMESFKQNVQDTTKSTYEGSLNRLERVQESVDTTISSLNEINDTVQSKKKAILEAMDERINDINLLKSNINESFEENQTNLSNIQSKMVDVESLDDKHYQTLHKITTDVYTTTKDLESSCQNMVDKRDELEKKIEQTTNETTAMLKDTLVFCSGKSNDLKILLDEFCGCKLQYPTHAGDTPQKVQPKSSLYIKTLSRNHNAADDGKKFNFVEDVNKENTRNALNTIYPKENNIDT